MRSWQLWLTRWSQRPHVSALLNVLAPIAHHRAFPLIGGVVAFAATITMSLPLAPVVSALVTMRPARWREIVFWSVLGSAAGAVMLAFALGSLGLPWLHDRMPELMTSEHWQHLVDWTDRYGWGVLAVVALSPLSQTPALMLAAMLKMPLSDIFIAISLGKTMKYSLIARITCLMAAKTAAPAPAAPPPTVKSVSPNQ